MDKEQIKALTELGKQGAILYTGALEESGSAETAKEVLFQFMRALLKPDSTKFFM